MKRARGNPASYARPVVASTTHGSAGANSVPGMPAIHRGSMVPTRWLGVAARLRGAHDHTDQHVRDLTDRGRAALGEDAFTVAYGKGWELEATAAVAEVGSAGRRG